MKLNVAIVGANKRSASDLFDELLIREFPLDNIFALGVEEAVGKKIKFGEDQTLTILDTHSFDFSTVDIVFFLDNTSLGEKYIPQAVEKGALVIDNSGAYKDDFQVPLVIPEINIHDLPYYKNKGIVSNPNCTTTLMLLALAPLHHEFIIHRIFVATYQAVSGAGNDALEELFEQTRGIYSQQHVSKTKSVFTKQIAFNIIPHIGEFLENGNTQEEQKLVNETKRIISPNIDVFPTCVRVPVFVSHSMVLNIEFAHEINEERIKEILHNNPNISVVDHKADEGYVTPHEVAGEDKVYISRIRIDNNHKNILSLWLVGDNLRRGIAINMIKIAEEILKIPTE